MEGGKARPLTPPPLESATVVHDDAPLRIRSCRTFRNGQTRKTVSEISERYVFIANIKSTVIVAAAAVNRVIKFEHN